MYQKNSMAAASLMLGILALFSGSVLFIAVPLGALAVLCAILSRTQKRLPRRSVIGIVTGLIASVGSCALTVQSFHYIMSNPQVRSYYGELFSSMLEAYGLSEEYNIFRDAKPDGGRVTEPDSVMPSSPDTLPDDSDEGGHSSKDYFDSMYDDYFRYFYGADPYHKDTPSPQNPSGSSQGGDFV